MGREATHLKWESEKGGKREERRAREASIDDDKMMSDDEDEDEEDDIVGGRSVGWEEVERSQRYTITSMSC